MNRTFRQSQIRYILIAILAAIGIARTALGAPAKVNVDTKTRAVTVDDGINTLDYKGCTLTLGNVTISDSAGIRTITLGSTNGTKIGATGDRIGFLGAGPIVRPSSTTDLRQALINLGLYTTGGSSPLNLNGGAFTSGTISGTSEALSSTLAVTGNSTFAGTLGVTGLFTGSAITLTGNETVGGTFGVTGGSTFAAVSGTTGTFSGTFHAGGNSTFSGTMGITGATTVGSSLVVTADSTVGTDLNVGQDLGVGRALNVTGATTGSTASYSSTVRGAIQDKGGQVFNVAAYGAVGDDSTDNTSFINATISAAGSTPNLAFPAGIYRTDAITLPANCTIIGAGKGVTVIKVKNGVTGGSSNTLLVIPSSSSNVTLSNLTLDGNRTHQGSYTSGVANSILFIGGTHVLISNVEITHSEVSGVFIGDNSTTATDISFSNCWIHDNGGTVNNAGIGVGVYSGGAATPDNIIFSGCAIENNYNTITQPNDSTALNLTATRVKVANCTFKNNFNVGGGQVAITDGSDGSGQIDAIVTGNTITKISSFGLDDTDGIEIQGRGFIVANNIINGFSSVGIKVEGAGGYGSITGNFIKSGTSAVRLYGNQTDPVTNVVVSGNTSANITTGLNLTSTNSNVAINANNFLAATDLYTAFGTLADSIAISGNLTNFGMPNELRTASTSGTVSLTTLTESTIVSISLPKGVWEVYGNVVFNKAATTGLTRTYASLSLTNNSSPITVGETAQDIYKFPGETVSGSGTPTLTVPIKRFVLTATTTVYLTAYAQFDTSTMTAAAKIYAVKADAIK